MARRRVWTALGVAVVSATGSVLVRRRQTRHQSRVDLYFDDGRAAGALARSLSATPLQRPGVPEGLPPTVFADPAGHPFCLYL